MTRLGCSCVVALSCFVGFARADDGGVANLDRRLATVESTGNPDDLGALADADVPALRAKLDELGKRGSEEGISSALGAARKANPSKYWADDFDLMAALVAARPSPMTDDFAIAIDIEAIFAALERIASTPALTAMIEQSGIHRAQFRFDVARRVRATGDRALPALILAKGGSSPQLRGWAGAQLEAMGKRVPGDAVQTKSDDVLVEVLTAFGTVHDRDALPVTLAFTSSERKRIRDAARASVLTYDKDALPKLLEVYTSLAGHPPLGEVTAAKVAADLFALQDKQRMADLDALVDLGLQKQAAGDNAGAVEQFDRALAREPSLDRRKEMVPAFVARGDSLADSDPIAARQAYEEALTLDPETPRKGIVRGAIALLDAEALRAKGIDDRASWERVLESDPGNAKAREALERMDAAKTERQSRANEWAWGAAAALALICFLVLFGLRNRRAR